MGSNLKQCLRRLIKIHQMILRVQHQQGITHALDDGVAGDGHNIQKLVPYKAMRNNKPVSEKVIEDQSIPARAGMLSR